MCVYIFNPNHKEHIYESVLNYIDKSSDLDDCNKNLGLKSVNLRIKKTDYTYVSLQEYWYFLNTLAKVEGIETLK